MKIPQNSNKFICIVEQFTRWQTNGDRYRTALKNYIDANHVKIDLL